MALANQTLKLEITPGGVPPKLHVTEYDENMQIVAQLFQRGQYYEIPSGTTAKVEGTLDGHPFSADATVDGSNVIFELTKGMTAYAGRAWTKIKLTKDGKPVSSCGFWLDCDRAGVEAGDVIQIQNSGFQEQINEGVAVYFAGNPPFFGVPPGGKTGQTLTKLSGSDYDTGWRTPTGGGGGGGGTVQSVNRVPPDDAGNVQLPTATQSAAGLMSAADKTALDGLSGAGVTLTPMTAAEMQAIWDEN